MPVVDGSDLRIEKGEVLALVGESGCGKSMTALSILRLVPKPGRIEAGRVRLAGRDLLPLPVAQMRSVRGGEIAMIFQEPMTSLNPVVRVGDPGGRGDTPARAGARGCRTGSGGRALRARRHPGSRRPGSPPIRTSSRADSSSAS